MSRLVRVGDSVRHAQAFGLARRIQRAAKLRTRHRAGCLVMCESIAEILIFGGPGIENIDFWCSGDRKY